MSTKPRYYNSIIDLMQTFSNERECLEHLKKMRWNGKPYCPHCGCEKVYEFSDKKRYKCSECRKKFTPTVGTIFEDSKVSLKKWFVAIYLITAHKKGISSLQLSRDIGVTQKTAWHMLHRLREASKTKAFNRPLKNVVEADETYIGGKEKNKHFGKRTENTQGRSVKTKTPVLGLVERQGQARVIKADVVNSQSVKSFITKNVVFGTWLMTDEYRAYRGLDLMYKHNFINHGEKEYVRKNVHTNTLEGFFSLFKRGIIGIYHFVSPKHLDRYLDEFTFRYNTREISNESRFDTILENCNGRLPYRILIAK